MKRQFRRDLCLALVLLALAAGLFALTRMNRAAGAFVEVRVDGALFGVYPLAEDAQIDIGGLCTLSVADGAAKITESTCRSGLCAHHRAIRTGGEMIVCLPNGITVKILSEDAPDFISR